MEFGATIGGAGAPRSQQGMGGSVAGPDTNPSKQGESVPWRRLVAAKFCDALEAAVVWAFHGRNAKQANFYLSGAYAPVDESEPAAARCVKGEVPACLNGEFVRVGPNAKFEPVANYHVFDGDGMMHGLRIKDGKATYVRRFVGTSRLQQEDYWGGAKFRKAGDMIGKQGIFFVLVYQLRVMLGVLDTSAGEGTANTAMVYHDGKLLSLHEADKPYAIRVLEDGDLETIGTFDYDKKLDHPFTAHPKLDPVTNELFMFGYQIQCPDSVVYRVISSDGSMGARVPITVSGQIMMHDFAITENYAIFMDCPLYFKPKDMVKKDQFIFEFDKTKPIRFGLLPRYAQNESQIRWFERPNGMIFHNANAWESGDEVVLISCRIPFLDLYGFRYGKEDPMPTCDVWEYRFNVKTGEVTDRQLGEFFCDFPQVHESYVGRKSRFVYTAVFDDAKKIIGIAKYDLEREPELGKKSLAVGGNVVGVFWHGPKCYGSEAIFVPKGSGTDAQEEDDGYLISFVHDEKIDKSRAVVVDARSMSSDPVAVIELPGRVPIGFHAIFVSEDKLRAQKL